MAGYSGWMQPGQKGDTAGYSYWRLPGRMGDPAGYSDWMLPRWTCNMWCPSLFRVAGPSRSREGTTNVNFRPRYQCSNFTSWRCNMGLISADCNRTILSLLTVPKSTDVIHNESSTRSTSLHKRARHFRTQILREYVETPKLKRLFHFRTPLYGMDSGLDAFNCYPTNSNFAALVTRQTAFASYLTSMFLSY